MTYSLAALAPEYAELFVSAELDPNRRPKILEAARHIVRHRARYEAVAARAGVPWVVIGILHHMEAGGDFSCHLHNGDPLTHRTRQRPAGRPPAPLVPPFTWQDSALDALRYDGLTLHQEPWTPSSVAFFAEKFNGFGPRARGHRSAYLWSWTSHEQPGKYVADGIWDPDARSEQPGAMALLHALIELGYGLDLTHGAPPVQRPASHATVEEIRPQSRKLRLIDRVRVLLGLGAAGTAPLTLTALIGYGKDLSNALGDLASNPLVLVLVGGCVLGVVAAVVLEQLHLDDYRAGRWTPSGASGDDAGGE